MGIKNIKTNYAELFSIRLTDENRKIVDASCKKNNVSINKFLNDLVAKHSDLIDIIEDKLFSMSQVCKIISKRDDIDLKIGRVKMFEYLRSFEVLNQNNIPVEKYLTSGNYFVVKKDVVMGKSYPTAYITKKGIDFIVSVFKDRNIIL